MPDDLIEIYTDGSCHTQHCIGAWVAIIFIAGEKIILSGEELNTTHNQMELTAVIKSLQYLQQLNKKIISKILSITIITDSQYVTGLQEREKKFAAKKFETKKGNAIRNVLLVKKMLLLTNSMPVKFVKIKAHQKKTVEINYNIEADKLSRNIVRRAVSLKYFINNKTTPIPIAPPVTPASISNNS